jgi:predicted small lipoprotein YifL
MRRLTSLLLLLSLLGLLGACGKKGPLYLPDPAPTPEQSNPPK